MLRLRASFLVCVSLALVHSRAAAQPRLVPEQRVRVLVTQGYDQFRTSGMVMEVAGDSVLLQVKGTQRYYPLRALSEVEVSAGRGSRPRWAVLGALSGAALGFGFSLYDRNGARDVRQERVTCTVNVCVYRYVKVPYPRSRTIGFTLGGSVLGTITGWLAPRDRWRPLEAPQAAAVPLPPPPDRESTADARYRFPDPIVHSSVLRTEWLSQRAQGTRRKPDASSSVSPVPSVRDSVWVAGRMHNQSGEAV